MSKSNFRAHNKVVLELSHTLSVLSGAALMLCKVELSSYHGDRTAHKA